MTLYVHRFWGTYKFNDPLGFMYCFQNRILKSNVFQETMTLTKAYSYLKLEKVRQLTEFREEKRVL